MENAPKLRGHHLICLHFFSGKGYSLEFVKNLEDTLKTIGELGVEISQGAMEDFQYRVLKYGKDYV